MTLNSRLDSVAAIQIEFWLEKMQFTIFEKNFDFSIFFAFCDLFKVRDLENRNPREKTMLLHIFSTFFDGNLSKMRFFSDFPKKAMMSLSTGGADSREFIKNTAFFNRIGFFPTIRPVPLYGMVQVQ